MKNILKIIKDDHVLQLKTNQGNKMMKYCLEIRKGKCTNTLKNNMQLR